MRIAEKLREASETAHAVQQKAVFQSEQAAEMSMKSKMLQTCSISGEERRKTH